jgi:hypothetical protein
MLIPNMVILRREALVKVYAIVIAFALVSVVILGCGDDNGGSGTPAGPPSVTQTSPQAGATDVNLNTLVRVWFDEPLDESTVDSAAFHVVGARTHRLEYDPGERMITLYLDTLLAAGTAYEAVVKSSIKSSGGPTMDADFDFSFTTGPLDCDHIEDYFEPNEDIASAALVEFDKVYPVLSSCGGEARYDYYKFVVEATSQVKAVARHVYADTISVSWLMQFWRDEDHQYGWTSSSFVPGGERSFRFTFHPGTYYAELRKYDDDHHYVCYDLEFQSLDPCEDDEFEDNDFIEEATPVTPGTITGLRGCWLDRDFFSTHLDSGQTLTATATQVTDLQVTRRMKIFNPAGISKIDTTFYAQGVPTSRSWTAQEGGTHYVKVRWWDDGIIYDLEIDVSD